MAPFSIILVGEFCVTIYSNDDALKFGQHIVNNLEFMYYDMENRANGEETFVIINTAGEPLTDTDFRTI